MSKRSIMLCLTYAFAAGVLAGVAGAAPQAGTRADAHQGSAAAKPKLPVWVITGKQVTPEAADILSESLGTFDSGLMPDGSIDYVDPDRFVFVPTLALEDDPEGTKPDEDGQETVSDALDFEGLDAIAPLDDEKALELAEGALADAQLDPLDGTKGITRTPVIGHSTVDVFSAEGINVISKPIDTHVDWDLTLGVKKIPLIGPGAQSKIVFDGDENTTAIRYAQWSMRQGQNAVIIGMSQANALALKEYRNQCGNTALAGLKLEGSLAYYAPPLSLPAKRIMPVYRFGGTARSGPGTVQLREIMVPAVQTGAPKVSLNASARGTAISGRAVVKGGTPPYTYQWESCSTPLDPAEASKPSISYAAGGRAASKRETLVLHVTDANGLVGSAAKTMAVSSRAAAPFRSLVSSLGRLDVGASTVGTAQGLAGCLPDTAGFVSRMALSGIPTQFHWTNNNAWESDFKDPSRPGGNDSSYVDDVDATFYCGHANGDGFTFPGLHTDTFLHHSDARWGNRDLEFLGIAACGPLQTTFGGLSWSTRWGGAFDGLHILGGYQTVSFDVTGEGFEWAHNMLGLFWWGGAQTVRQAWISMAISQQPSSVQWAVMGAFGSGGVSNWNDYFWGAGPTGPDIPAGSVTGWWKVSGPA